MALPPGTRLGAYEVVSLLGAGGMGEVYKARDTRLDRIVAIKVLREHLANDPSRRARFDREARAISKLNHPHICTLYDVGYDQGVDYLVVEYIEGQTLAERLTKGALPIDQALAIAIDVADALDAAHRAAIVHRDLKPANVMLTKAGAKLLDFGIARVAQVADALTASTAPGTLTINGSLVGTPSYMAPEQLEGRAADARSDIFAFGVLLYEALAGRGAFDGGNAARVAAAVLDSHPPSLANVSPPVPNALQEVVAVCLAKDPDERWQSTSDLSRVLKSIAAARHDGTADVRATVRPLGMRWIAGFLAVLVITASIWLATRPHAERAVERPLMLALVAPERTSFDSLAVSPNGQHLAFTATDAEGRTELWLRASDSTSARRLKGTAHAAFPFWSPDSRFVGFSADGTLKKINVDTEQIEIISTRTGGSRGGSWSQNDTVILAAATDPLFRIGASEGSRAEPLTHLDESKEETSHRWPWFLPDGRHYLYTVRSGLASVAGVYVADLMTSKPRRLIPDVSNAAFVRVPDGAGYLLFVREHALMAQPFDPDRLQLAGDAKIVADDVAFAPGFSLGSFSASQTGLLVYTSVLPNQNTELAWFDRRGTRVGVVRQRSVGCNRASLSPDDHKLAFDCIDGQSGKRDVFVVDLLRGVRSLVAPGAAAVWSPDSSLVAFATRDAGDRDIVERPSDGSGPERTVLRNTTAAPAGWSPDGRWLLLRTNADFSLLSMAHPDVHPVPYSRFANRSTPLRGDAHVFSPDGRWLAYTSMEAGQREVVVESFDPGGRNEQQAKRWQLSNDGGELPRWRRDGRELFYLSPKDGHVQSVQIRNTGAGIEPQAPTTLFSVSLTQTLQPDFDVSADGQRFLLQVTAPEAQSTPATVVMNWAGLLKP